ncbi:YeeE/YedE thiosulfate transporter family protein [Helicobacter pametensis]|uniref:YeeE/YedE thiosulfate transporter family protein n=1 Tax=Helicobacter pametensis TaxID=95149 RepID=UPI000485D087|nr:YeeE/YedE thiosulfate transporter family protein [Helicobacter pametensis]
MNIHWSILGFFLGGVFFLAIWIVKPIGISTQFSTISAMAYGAINSDLITKDIDGNYSSSNPYLNKDKAKLAKKVKEPWGYDLIFFLSVPLGALIGFLLFSKNKQIQWSISTKEIIIGFLGGFLLLYGARMAGGCTSGHMMSGIMQSSMSGFVFALCVFASGIAYTKLRRQS